MCPQKLDGARQTSSRGRTDPAPVTSEMKAMRREQNVGSSGAGGEVMATRPNPVGVLLRAEKHFHRSHPRKRSLTQVALSAGLLLLTISAVLGTELGLTVFPSNRQSQVTLTGGTGRWHRVETSTNLLDWGDWISLFQTNPASAWVDSDAANQPRRFYRSLQRTPLESYVAAPDTNYSYTVLSTNPGTGQTTYVLELRSQVWLTTNEVDRPL